MLYIIVIIIVSSLLFLQQFWEYLALGRRYFRELESWFKVCICSLALTAMLFMENLVRKLLDKLNYLPGNFAGCSQRCRLCCDMFGLDRDNFYDWKISISGGKVQHHVLQHH